MQLKHALAGARRSTRGLSIVELLIGVTIGLFVLAGASLVVTEQLVDNRRLMLEIQLQQDLRAASDIITRDIRRAGYYGNSFKALWPADAAAAAAARVNPYAATLPAASPPSAPVPTPSMEYYYSTDRFDDPLIIDNDRVDESREHSGVRFDIASGVLKMYLGAGGWQELTDPKVLRVKAFNVVFTGTPVDVPCATPCPPGSPTCPPQQIVRNATITIVGEAVHDARVERSIRSDVRLRNDLFTGACP